MHLLSFFTRKKKRFLITESDIKKEGKHYYYSVKNFLLDLYKMSDSLGLDKKSVKQSIHQAEGDYGINFFEKYDQSVLSNDGFKLDCIMVICINKSLKRKIGYAEYGFYKDMMENMIKATQTGRNLLNIHIPIIEKYKIDPSIFPESHRKKMAQIDEYQTATELIIKELGKIENPNNEKFKKFIDYYDYVKEKSAEIIHILAAHSCFNTHDLERFTVLCVAYKMNISPVDSLYKIPDGMHDGKNPNIPTKIVKSLIAKLSETLFGMDAEGETGGGQILGDSEE